MLYATDASTTVKKRLTAAGRAEALRLCPWGNATRGFTGAGLHGERDEGIGLYMLGAGYRGYIPSLRRFNSPDSWSPFGRGGINAYAFCGGEPVNGRDPTGHAPVDVAASFLKSFIREMYDPGVYPKMAFNRAAHGVSESLTVTDQMYSPLGYMYKLGHRIATTPTYTRNSEAYKYLAGMSARKAKRISGIRGDQSHQFSLADLQGPLPEGFSRFYNGLSKHFPAELRGRARVEYFADTDASQMYSDRVREAIWKDLFWKEV